MHDFRIIVDPCFRPKFAFGHGLCQPRDYSPLSFHTCIVQSLRSCPVRRVHDNALERVCVSAAES